MSDVFNAMFDGEEGNRIFDELIASAMRPAPSYQASHINGRRATKEQVARRRAALLAIVRDMRPMTVRQVFLSTAE